MPTKKPRKKPAAIALKNPPPAGTVWERIEEERLALGWSARELDDQADATPNHFTLIATRGNWSEVQSSVRDEYVAALVRAGVDPKRFVIDDLTHERPVAGRTLSLSGDIDTQSMVESAAEMLQDLDGLSLARSLELLYGVKLQNPTVEGYYKAGRLRMNAERGDRIPGAIITEEFGPSRKVKK